MSQNRYDLMDHTVLGFGKYRGSVCGQVMSNDKDYACWLQENSPYNIINFEALTGLQKPDKTEEAYEKYQKGEFNVGGNSNNSAPTRTRPAYKVPQPSKMQITSLAEALIPDDFLELERQDMIWLLHVVSKAYKTKFNRSLLEDALRIDPRSAKDIENEKVNNANKFENAVKSTGSTKEVPEEDDDDLPF